LLFFPHSFSKNPLNFYPPFNDLKPAQKAPLKYSSFNLSAPMHQVLYRYFHARVLSSGISHYYHKKISIASVFEKKFDIQTIFLFLKYLHLKFLCGKSFVGEK